MKLAAKTTKTNEPMKKFAVFSHRYIEPQVPEHSFTGFGSAFDDRMKLKFVDVSLCCVYPANISS